MTTEIKELALRRGNGSDVALLWRPADNQVRVAVRDLEAGQTFEVVVAPQDALDAYHHPYAYAATHGMAFCEELFVAA